ncbi:ribosomal RNA small subunit methyltransferase G [Oceaniovalibus guishaninsula JLT2003]|uniref:Ribosomal RNA small subunit methyltransferase G n=1 Tax=Oceaniovalibus guishaninsula JLT2003 TaxID=1231392 RepID=K2HP83_9RHOB|nr:ribosomal RNA small subunit methyltransferase G [Oceaniovalibus guishaninsula JLT2003]
MVSVARPDVPMTLIESDNRKAAFLREVVRQLRLDCTVIADRIERIEPQNAAIISARALAPLSELLGLAARHATPETVYLLPKGRDWEMEVVKARGMWQFDMETFPSQTDAQGRILKLRSVRRVASESGS